MLGPNQSLSDLFNAWKDFQRPSEFRVTGMQILTQQTTLALEKLLQPIISTFCEIWASSFKTLNLIFYTK